MFIQGFSELDTMRSRQMTMAGSLVGKIPWESIDRYAIRLGLDDQNTELFTRMIRGMDGVYLEHEHKRIQKETAKAKPKTKKVQ